MPSQQTKQTFIEVWFERRFTTASVAFHANVPETTVENMKAAQPVERIHAIAVLDYLTDRYRQTYSLATVHVPLLQNSPQKSEIARLMADIDLQYQAAHGALTDFAAGSSKHTYITHRMTHMGERMMELAQTYGANIVMEALIDWQSNLASETQECC